MDALLPIERARAHMPFVTTLTLQSGDRDLLERVVGDIKQRAERKGVELKGPHAGSPMEQRVPQSKRLSSDGDRFPAWEYTVYLRQMEVVGHDEFAREVAKGTFPKSIHLDVDVERVSTPGGK
jgi:ribosomal protein S10